MMAIASAGPRAGFLSSPLGRCAAAVIAYLALAGATAWAGLVQCGARPGLGEAMVCAAPLCAGLALAFGARHDRRQAIGRLVAAALVLPLLLLMAVATQDPEPPQALSVGVFVAVYALMHLMAAVTGIALLAAATTRVVAVRGVAPVGADRLGRRLLSLNGAGLALAVQGGDGLWLVEIDAGAGRSHRLRLQLDELGAQLIVHERLGAAAVTPQTESTVIWSHEWQATMIDEVPLNATVLAFDGDRALPPHAARGYDGDALVRLLCALVTRSGYAWQPVLLSWPKRRRARH